MLILCFLFLTLAFHLLCRARGRWYFSKIPNVVVLSIISLNASSLLLYYMLTKWPVQSYWLNWPHRLTPPWSSHFLFCTNSQVSMNSMLSVLFHIISAFIVIITVAEIYIMFIMCQCYAQCFIYFTHLNKWSYLLPQLGGRMDDTVELSWTAIQQRIFPNKNLIGLFYK